MHKRLRGNSTTRGSSVAPRAQTVSPAIMAAKAGAIGMARRRQAKTARAPERTAATPTGIASGTLWNVIVPAPDGSEWQRSSDPRGLAAIGPGGLGHIRRSLISHGRARCETGDPGTRLPTTCVWFTDRLAISGT